MQIKYLVVKHEDIQKWVPMWYQERVLDVILDTVKDGREIDGKKENSYIVINMDEPYIQEIIDVMRRHGHWED